MKIKVHRTSSEEVEVSFPIYSHFDHDLDVCPSESWTRVELVDGIPMETTIHYQGQWHSDLADWSVRTSRWGAQVGTHGEDFMLGKGQYKCSKAEWDAALARFRAHLEAVAR